MEVVDKKHHVLKKLNLEKNKKKGEMIRECRNKKTQSTPQTFHNQINSNV